MELEGRLRLVSASLYKVNDDDVGGIVAAREVPKGWSTVTEWHMARIPPSSSLDDARLERRTVVFSADLRLANASLFFFLLSLRIALVLASTDCTLGIFCAFQIQLLGKVGCSVFSYSER